MLLLDEAKVLIRGGKRKRSGALLEQNHGLGQLIRVSVEQPAGVGRGRGKRANAGENSARRFASPAALAASSRSPAARAIRTICASSAKSGHSLGSTWRRSDWPIAQSHW